MKYKTHIDNLYCVIISCFFAASFALGLCIIIAGTTKEFAVLATLYLFLVTMVCYFFCERYYIFKKDEYIIQVGFFTKKYRYADINKCFITKNNKISYATSQKRICIKTNNKTLYISPENINEALLILINGRA